MDILFAASEVAPFTGTSEMAHTVGSLAKAVSDLGHRVSIVLPRYGSVDPDQFSLAKRLRKLPISMPKETMEAHIFEGKYSDNVHVYMIEYAPLFGRDELSGPTGEKAPVNALRYAFFSRAVIELCRKFRLHPDIIHIHDWPPSLLPLFIDRSSSGPMAKAKTLLTIHDIRNQGLFDREVMEQIGIPWDLFTPDGVEYFGQVNFLKAAILFSDFISTVSQTHANELRTKEMGQGLDGVISQRADKLRGILNGIDYDCWNPAKDRWLPMEFEIENLRGKAVCKAAVQRELGLDEEDHVPILATIARLTDQSGFDLVVESIDELLSSEIQYVVIGTGDQKYHQLFEEIARRNPQKMAFRSHADEGLLHRLAAGSDILLHPAHSEPAGVNQLRALPYGTVLVARAVGGVADVIEDFNSRTSTGNGFLFHSMRTGQMMSSVRRALRAYKNRRTWLSIMRRSMSMDLSWEVAATKYEDLYGEILAVKREQEP